MGRSNVTKVIFGLSIVAAVLVSESTQAEITTVGYWQLGENDPGTAAGLSGASQTIASVASRCGHHTGSATYAAVSGTGSAQTAPFAIELGGGYYQSATTSPLAATDNFGMSFYVKASTFANDSYLVFNGYPYGNNGWGILELTTDGVNNFEWTCCGVNDGAIEPFQANTWTQLRTGSRQRGDEHLRRRQIRRLRERPSPRTATLGLMVGECDYAGLTAAGTVIDDVRLFTFAAGAFQVSDLSVPQPSCLV